MGRLRRHPWGQEPRPVSAGAPPTGIGAGMVYRPTVQFTTPHGTQHTATSPIGSNPRQGHVGDTVTVLYDPSNPQRVRVASRSATGTCLEVGFMLFGGGLAALGLLILIASR